MKIGPYTQFVDLDMQEKTTTIVAKTNQEFPMKKVTKEDIFNFEELYRVYGNSHSVQNGNGSNEQINFNRLKKNPDEIKDKSTKNKQTKNLTFWQKIKNIFNLLFKKEPTLYLSADTKIQLQQNSIKIEGDLHLNASGSIYLFADKHIVLQSGRTEEPDRPGYLYSIWMNSDLDQNMNPLKKE